MSAKTDEKRIEFAKRIGEELEKCTVMWQIDEPSSQRLIAPHNAESGRPYKGLNALYLMQQADDKGFTDSSWLTVKDANKQGDRVKAGEKGVSVEYWGQNGDKTGSYSYPVFNAEQLESYRQSEVKPAPPEPDYKKAAAILEKNGADVPNISANDSPDRVRGMYVMALTDMISKAGENTLIFKDVQTPELKNLRESIACTFLSWETQIPLASRDRISRVESWGKSIQHNPSELFQAIRDAGKLVSEMVKGLKLEQEQPKPPERTAERETEAASQAAAVQDEQKSKAIVPKVGDRVTFRPKRSGQTENAEKAIPSVTGEVTGVDDFKGTVTLKCGDKSVPVFRGKGMFFEAPPLEQEATKEHAQNLAQKHVGENGKVFFARNEGVYKGTIVETTPTYAVQEVSKGMAVLHRLKDLGQDNETQIQKGRDIVIQKEAGRVTVVPNTPRQKEKEQGVER